LVVANISEVTSAKSARTMLLKPIDLIIISLPPFQ
jgi:hypothetical protein